MSPEVVSCHESLFAESDEVDRVVSGGFECGAWNQRRWAAAGWTCGRYATTSSPSSTTRAGRQSRRQADPGPLHQGERPAAEPTLARPARRRGTGRRGMRSPGAACPVGRRRRGDRRYGSCATCFAIGRRGRACWCICPPACRRRRALGRQPCSGPRRRATEDTAADPGWPHLRPAVSGVVSPTVTAGGRARGGWPGSRMVPPSDEYRVSRQQPGRAPGSGQGIAGVAGQTTDERSCRG
jgi:hypothetical protein